MISKTNLLHLILKLGFLFVLFGDFSTVFTQTNPGTPEGFEDPDPVPEEELPPPYRAGNCIVDDHFVFKEILEDPSLDDIPPYPGTVINNYNMNCTNPDPAITTPMADCICTSYIDGSDYECFNET